MPRGALERHSRLCQEGSAPGETWPRALSPKDSRAKGCSAQLVQIRPAGTTLCVEQGYSWVLCADKDFLILVKYAHPEIRHANYL